MNLFVPDPTERRPRAPGESLFDFCCKSNAPELHKGRAIVNQWLQSYPESAQNEIQARLKSSKDSNHFSAMHELQLYSLFNESGFIVHLVPQNDGSNPDLKLIMAGGEEVFVEASLRLDSSCSALFDLMQYATPKVAPEEPRLRVFVHNSHETTTMPASAKLARFLLREYSALLQSHGQIEDHDYTELGRVNFEDSKSGWSIQCTLFAAPIDSEPDSTIAMSLGATSFWSQAVPFLQKKLEEKLLQHKKLTAPILIAIGWEDFAHKPDHDDILKALCERPKVYGRKIAGLIFTYPNASLWATEPKRSEIWLEANAPAFLLNAKWPFSKYVYDADSAMTIS